MSWVQDLVDVFAESESPERFFYWSGLTILSATLRKNVFLDRHIYKLYPNIYVFLVAKSGMKKGIPVSNAKKLLEMAGLSRVISGRNSMPKILEMLGKQYSLPNGGVIATAQAAIISGELSDLLVKDPDALTILTDLYNCHEYEEKWENSLKGTGTDTLKQPCITILGATNEEHFDAAVTSRDRKGGFIARTNIVYATDRVKTNSLVRKPAADPDLSKFIPYLKDVATLKGQFEWTSETADFFEDWYNDFKANAPDDPYGIYNRIDDTILRIAILLSISKNLDLKMDLDSLKEAKAECLNCAQGAHQICMGAGKSNYASQTALIMRALISHPDHKLTRMQILRRFWGDISATDLDLIAETMMGQGAVEVYHVGKDTVYQMPQKIVDEYESYARKVKGAP
jgi:hypothetical protein